MKSIFVAVMIAGASLLVASPVFAQATGNMGVSLTVQDECTMAAGPLTFGNTGLVDTTIDLTAALTVQCTAGSPYAIALSAGGSGDVAARVMTNTDSADTVDYDLFRETGRTTNWGATIGTDTVDSVGATGADETITVFGRVPAGQNVPAGDYADTIVATIWYGAALD